MYIQINDGILIFGTNLVRVDITMIVNLPGISQFQIEPEGIVCYSPEEYQRAKETLDGRGIPHRDEELTPDPSLVKKAKDVKYNSRTEAMDHLIKDIEPDSLVIGNLKKRLDEKEGDLKELKELLKSKKII